MESITLTPRLELVASMVPQGARLADIGADHGKLPIRLLLAGRIRAAIGSDIREGPLSHAARNAREHGAALSLRLAPGLSGIHPSECDVITIAGMGGETIAEILADARWTAEGRHLLILQPMTMLPTLRRHLAALGFRTERERICREGKNFYLVIAARGSGTAPLPEPSPLDALVPKALLSDPLAEDYCSALLEKERAILRGLRAGRQIAPDRLAAQDALVRAFEQRLEELK